jgi:YesN/AraC family two-component response regulator
VEWKGARASWHVIHFDFSFPFNPFLNKTSRPQILQVENAFLLLKDFQLLTNEKNPHLILSLFYRIFGNLYGRIKYEDEPKQTIIQPALDYLENHYKEKIYTDKLARLCLLSRSKFQSLFKEITKTSPIAYKNSLLIQSLQQALILDEKKSLETLSVEFGFDSTVYLCKLFKKLTGKTPTEYRKCTFSL